MLEAEATAFEEAVERTDPRIDPPGLDPGDRFLRDPDLRGKLTLSQARSLPCMSEHPTGH